MAFSSEGKRLHAMAKSGAIMTRRESFCRPRCAQGLVERYSSLSRGQSSVRLRMLRGERTVRSSRIHGQRQYLCGWPRLSAAAGRAVGIICKGVAEIVRVGETEIAEAVRLIYTDPHNVAEGAGAAPFAAILKQREALQGKRVAIVQSQHHHGSGRSKVPRKRLLYVHGGAFLA